MASGRTHVSRFVPSRPAGTTSCLLTALSPEWNSPRSMPAYVGRFMRLVIPLAALPFLASIVATQGRGPADRERPINASDHPLLAPFQFRSIGPASIGGRIDDIAVSESDPNVIY